MDKIKDAINYEYQILRYRHDVVSGEFVNLGIVYYDPKKKVLKAEFINKYGRLSQFFGDVSGTFLLRSLRKLKSGFDKLAKQLQTEIDFLPSEHIEGLTHSVLPEDDNALFFSEVYKGWHFEHEIAFKELYQRIIARYLEEPVERHDDAYAWHHIYKRYFDENNITPKLKHGVVKTAFDEVEFDKTVRNGKLHCFQSVSFDLKHGVKEKIYRWDGKIRELETAEEPLKLYLLSLLPDDKSLNKMIEQKLNVSSPNIEVKVIGEREAQKAVREVKSALEAAH